ncbi:GLIPR1-like protein 1 [Strongylocentrotus purpuratus]|uniref:SCP domain-containing protein n=1 Tax=Strongylocentrotus purpuratus TaxID=7668 RepID=A0A7M7NLJ7_STRPU|nr:GLIPR1-like protein 1 [Strongylocentrotus purpuratus]
MICALSLVLVLAVSFGEMAEVTDLTEEWLPVVNGIYNQWDRDKILARHNHFRSKVQPSAANMVALQWSHDLAGLAQRWANRCDFGFNFRSLVTEFSSVGQNIAQVYAGTLDSIMDSWNNEKADYDFETNTCSAFCAHYTQQWSHDLSGLAQRWANRCDFGFNFRSLVTEFSSVGQNIAQVYAGTLDSIMDSWNNEKADYDFETNTCSAFCAHYTQMVWATTSFIGCGRAACPPHSLYRPDTYIVCNYGPGGNVTHRPYESGVPCSSCPDSEGDTYSCENNLCTLG